MCPVIKIKPEKEHLLESRHPWIFSGALELDKKLESGSLVKIADSKGKIAATGTFSANSNIAVRVFEFGDTAIDGDWLTHKIETAHRRRLLIGYGPQSDTTGYRVLFGESDGIPGLVVDKYVDVLVVQLSTAGADKLRQLIVECLSEVFAPRAIVERSDLTNRKEEKLNQQTGVLLGEVAAEESVQFSEYGLKFLAHPLKGQKTGFYLDQKDARKIVRQLANGANSLNLFSYTGASAIAALAGGANSVLNIDDSDWALGQCTEIAELNGLDAGKIRSEKADVFQWLDKNPKEKFDLVLMDPPALIKSRKESENGRKAYHFLNRAAMRLVKPGGIFVTSSCSQFFTLEELTTTLRRASVQNNVELQLLKEVSQPADHPVSLYFPESGYLKTIVGVVN